PSLEATNPPWSAWPIGWDSEGLQGDGPLTSVALGPPPRRLSGARVLGRSRRRARPRGDTASIRRRAASRAGAGSVRATDRDSRPAGGPFRSQSDASCP